MNWNIKLEKKVSIKFEIKIIVFYKIDNSKKEDSIEKCEIKTYNFKKDCPNLQFSIGPNFLDKDDFFKITDEYFLIIKK